MKRLIIGFLKLLLQLLIFALTGRWMQIGPPQPDPAVERRTRQPPRSGEQSAKRRPLFDARQRGSRERSLEAALEGRSLEEQGESFERSLPPPETLVEEHVERPRKVRRKSARAPRKPLALPEREPPVHSFGRALRDPRALRQALIVGAALGPRRRMR